MSEALLSVIIPVHNGERCICQTAEGILAQSYKTLELILVENFSEDRSTEICEDLKKKTTEFDFIIVMKKELQWQDVLE